MKIGTNGGIGIIIALLATSAQVGAENVILKFSEQVESEMRDNVSSFQVPDDMATIRKFESATHEKLGSFRSGSPKTLGNALAEWNEMIHATHEMKEKMMVLYGTAGETTMHHQLEAAHSTAMNMMQIIGAVEDANVSDDRRAVRRGAFKSSQREGRAHVSAASRNAVTAGDLGFADLALSGSYTTFDDDAAAADGEEWELALSTAFDLSETLSAGLTVSRNQFEIGGLTDLRRESDVIDVHLLHTVNDWLALSVFAAYASIDVDDTSFTDDFLGTISFSDSYDRWNGGIAASINREIGGFDLGVTPALSSLNADSPGDLIDGDQLAFSCLVDLQRAWSDNLSSIVYASYFSAIADELPGDHAFWFVGGELSWAIDDRISVGLGYEKTVGYEDYEDNRVLGSFTWIF